MFNETFYSTIASINGVWISILSSLGLLTLTYGIKLKIFFVTSQRNEKKKLYSNIYNLTNNIHFTTFKRVHSDEEAHELFAETSQCIKSQYNEPGKDDKTVTVKDIGKIQAFVKDIVSCYPHPDEIGNTFMTTDELLFNDKEYKEWIKRYYKRIGVTTLPKIFEMISYNISLLKANWTLKPNVIYEVEQIQSAMNSLIGIEHSIHAIKILEKDYSATEVIRKKSTLYQVIIILSLNSLFGLLLPLFMLSPIRFNHLSENSIIFFIFVGLFISYILEVLMARHIFKSIKFNTNVGF